MTVNHGVLGSSPRGGAQREKSKRFLSFFCFSPLCFSKHIIGLKSQRKILKKQRKNLKKQRKKTIFLCFFLQDLQTTLHIQ
jgi:hypothetical protein